MLQTAAKQDLYLTAYEEFERRAANTDPVWLHQIRKEAITRFKELGFPGKRNEDWKYTNLTPLLQSPFKLAQSDSKEGVEETIRPCVFDDSHQIVFVNGRYEKDLSVFCDMPDGLTLTNLQTAVEKREDRLEAHLAQYADHDELPFVALNTAFLNDGAVLFVGDGIVIRKPIHVVYLSTAPIEPLMSFPRILLAAGKNSQVTLIETYVGPAEEKYFTNAVTEIHAAENAVVDHYKVLRESNAAFHIANLQVHQESNSNVSSQYFAMSGGLARNASRIIFNGENSECVLNGLYLGCDNQHIDNLTEIDHARPHCNSHELYKGILDDKAKGVFNGKIYVRPDAQKTDARQSNQCILLSEQATIDTKPQLEIFADDVKCTHGATVGQLDQEALFYLRSRGIAHDRARRLLIYAFANDVIQRIKVDPIRAQLEDALLTRHDLPAF